MRQRWNGSIQSSNVPSYDREGVKRDDYGLYRCMVVDVLYVDDDKNISKNAKNPEVLYEVVILGGAASGQKLSYCRLASYLGGNLNVDERTLTKSSKDISKTKLSELDGDVVFVQFTQGHDAYPQIIGMAKGISNKIGAKKADGPRWLQEYNGVNRLIDNKGNLTVTLKGGTLTNGFFKNGDTSVITDLLSVTDEKFTRTFKSGLTVTEDGKNDQVIIKTKGGVTATVNGKNNNVSLKAGSTEILIDGASGKISLKGAMIDLGSSVSDFVTMFTQLSTAFNQHTHQYTDNGNPAMTQPPSAPLLTSVGSQTVKVQS